MAEYTVSRAISIAAPGDKVFRLVANLREWALWSPWEGLDPALRRSYSGAESGVGQRYEWEGNRKAGRGSMRIDEAVEPGADGMPGRVVIAVQFLKPFPSTSTSRFTITPSAQGPTQVEWTMTGQQKTPMALLGKLWSMDKLMGPDFERGLKQLRQVAEA